MVVFEARPGRPVSRWSRCRSRPAGGCATSPARSTSCARRRTTLGDAFLRVTVRAEAPVPGLVERVKELLPNALEVAVELPAARGRPRRTRGETRAGMDPARLFAEYYRKRNRADAPDALRALFAELYEEASR